MLSAAPRPHPDRQSLIAQARQALLAEGAVPARAEVEPWIARSWQRCLASGLQPSQRVAFDLVSAAALRHSHEQNQHLLRAARPVLEQLSRAIAGMRYFAMLTDARGTVVEVQGPVDRQDPRASTIGRVGIDLSEAAVGTTAIGAALAELQPVWLHRGEHFFDDNGSYSCAGAPLFDPHGRCVGMLDLTGVDVPERPELRHLVARSARAMEDALLQQLPFALLLRVNWPGCALGSEGDGLVALDGDGYVLGCNSLARQLLPMPLSPPGTALHCGDLMALPWTLLFDTARHRGAHTPIDLPLWSGLRLHGVALRPDSARSVHHGAHPASAYPQLGHPVPASAPMPMPEPAPSPRPHCAKPKPR